MNWFVIAVSALLVAQLLIASWSLARSRAARSRKLVLCALRLSAAAIILLAFFQPTWRFSRLAAPSETAVLLVDVSESMQLFKGDSAVRSIIQRLDSAGVATQTYCFGDSLRFVADTDSLTFRDRSSFLPTTLDTGALADIPTALLISDGNFSNASVPRSLSESKAMYHIPLPPVHPVPYLAVSVDNYQRRVPTDSSSAASVRIAGYSSGRTPVTLTVRSEGAIIARRQLDVSEGHFIDTATIRLPARQIGAHLYEVAVTSEDSLHSAAYFMQQSVSQRYLVRLFGAPSLDMRFLRMSINARKDILDAADTVALSELSAVIFCEWDDTARSILHRLPPDVSAIFAGALPCDSIVFRRDPTLRFMATSAFADRGLAYSLTAPPPPAALLLCSTMALPVRDTLIAAIDSVDDVAVLYEALYRNRRILVFAAQGLWRWDFWPLSLGQGEVSRRFSDIFLDVCTRLIDRNANRSFHVYPRTSPIYETDSIAFTYALPAALQSADRVALRLSLIDSLGQAALRDSLAAGFSQGMRAGMTVGPVSPGVYRFEASAAGPDISVRFSDSIRVMPANAERRIQGSNTVLLNKISQPLSSSDAAEFISDFRDRRTPDTRVRTMRIGMNWPLITLLLALLALEWALRRIWRFERS
jgi:hypothetical protein